MNEDSMKYKVVINHEEQYSIWPEHRENPAGWRDAGKAGSKDECLAYVKEVWTDMRPLSLRKKMADLAKNPPAPKEIQVDNTPNLVERLSEGQHTVEVGLRPEKNVRAFKESLDRGYVHIKFTETRGGTELGVHLDKEASDFSKANFDEGAGSVHIVGGLTLDFNKVRCIAEIDLRSLTGKGRLERIAA